MTKKQAQRIALDECNRRGWKWQEPVLVKWGILSFTVWTNANRKGGNCCLKIRKKDGSILSAGRTPR